MPRFLPTLLMTVMLLLTGAASAQTTNIAQWDIGTSAFSRDASDQSLLVSTSPFNINNSVITLTQKNNTSGNTGYFGQVGSWTNTATNSTATRTALTPRANTKSLYANFDIRPEATGDFSNLTLTFKYQRAASSAPTKVRAFLTWQNGSTYYTRYSALTSLSSTTSTTVWTASPSLTFSTGTTAFPSGTALASKSFLLELEFSTVSNSTNNIYVDDIALTANSLCSNVQIGSTGALPGATMGTAYSRATTVSGGIGSYTWAVVSGTLPPGVTVNTASGLLSGTPVSWGDFDFTLRATDSVGCSDDSDFTLTVAPAAGCGNLVEYDFSNYTNGTTVDPTSANPIQYSFKDSRVNATGMVGPSGVYLYGSSAACFYNLDQGTHAISFTVSVPAGSATSWDMVDFIFDYQAETASPTAMHVEVSKLNTTTGLYDKFYTSTSTPVPHYSLGFAHYRHSTAGGAVGPAAFDSRINPGQTFKYSIIAEGTVTNASMDLSGLQLLGCPVACPTVSVSPGSISSGISGGAYNAALSVSGGTTPFTWTVSSGALPAGVTLNSSTGVISGTPTASGTFGFTARATGADGCSGATTYSLSIAAAPTNDYGDFSSVASGWSTMSASLRMGSNVDAEPSDSFKNTSATGDDASATDDEDGVTMPATIMPGQSVTIPVVVTNTSGVAAYLDAWIDFNNNGSLTDSGEQVAVNIAVANGSSAVTKNVTFTVPSGATINNGCGVRFRLTTTNNATSTGAAGTGEVEDYVVAINSSLTIGNLIWNDANDNGVKEVAESGINGVLVEVWSPGSDNARGGTGGAADVKVSTTTTSGGGLYSFAGLAPGYYFVKVPTPPLTRTSVVVDSTDNGQDNDNNGVQPGGYATSAFSPVIQLASGQEPGTGGGGNSDNTIDFGFASNIGSPFACDNRFFVMQNRETSSGSGIWDSTLYYIDPGPVLVPTFIFTGKKLNAMAAFGGYLYCMDQNGNNLYRINSDGLLVDMGAIPGLPAPGTAGQWSGATALTTGKMILNELVNSPQSTVIYTIDLTSATLVGSGVTCKDASNGTVLAGNFGDIAWDPLTGNTYGYFTNAPNLGLWNINTTTGNCTKVASGSMGSNGSIVIDANGLTYAYGGSGSVQDTLYVFNRTNGVLDGTFDAESSGPTVSNSDGAACPGAPPSMKIGNIVWSDSNNNGIKEAGEVGIDGVGIQLFLGGQNPATDAPTAVTTTSGGGFYTFDRLSPGQYFVYIPTPPYPNSSSVTDTADNNQDNDDNGIQTATGQPVKSPLIALAGGTEPNADGDTDFNSDLTVDFGFFGMSIGNLVWSDVNKDGLKGASEPGIGGVTVGLYNPGADGVVNTADDTLRTTTTTDGTGAYRFDGLVDGSYYVKVTPPPGFALTGGTPATTDNNVDGNNDGSQPSGPATPLFSPKITLAAGTESVTDGDTDPNTNLTVDFGLFSGFSVGDLVWNDVDNDGIVDSGELGISSVVVELMSPGADNAIGGTGSNADTVVASDSTDISGNYSFRTYTAGKYYVRVTPPTSHQLASSVRVATDNGVDNDNNGGQTGGAGNFSFSPIFTLAAGLEPGTAGTTNNEMTIDFGLRACPTIALSPASLINGTKFAAYSQTFTASGGTSPYNWLLAGGTIPTGLTLTSAGVLSGTITGVPGTYNIVIQGMDALGCIGVKAYTLTVNCPTVTVTTGSLPGGTVNTAYTSTTLAASGGTSPYAWALTSGSLPAGLSLSSAGIVSGTVTGASGNYPITVSATDANLCSATKAFSITVSCPTVTITTASLPAATQNTAYPGTTLTMTGGTAPYSWSLSSGSLPTGLTLSSAGVLSGTITGAPGAYNIVVQAADAFACADTQAFTITINSPADLGDWNGSGALTTTTTSIVNATLRLGATVDAEQSVTPNAAATADGADEDGVTMPASITQANSVTIPVSVFNNRGANAYLNAWIDFNNDGIFNDTVLNGANGGERLEAVRTIATGASATTQNINFTVPAAASAGTQRGVRFRLTDQAITAPTGAVGIGEVEDYVVTVNPGLSIGNLVWNDLNTNGAKDTGEAGISGVTVQLFNPVNGIVGDGDDVQVGANTTTSVTGGYGFAGLVAGNYYVKVTTPVGYPLTSGTPVTLDNGVNNDNNGAQPGGLSTAVFSPIINLAYNAESIADGDADANTEFSIDFGFFTGMLVGDVVFNDLNNNGIKDVGETGVSSLTVELLNGGTNAVISSTTTNSSGNYGFTVYTAGSYKIRVTPNATCPLASTAAVGTDNATDNNNDGTQPGWGQPSTSFAFSLTPGGEPGTAGTTNTENTIDFGFFMPTTDFGDYTTFADASSTVIPTIKIGATTDTELSSTRNATATGDDVTNTGSVDDEDGVTIPATITQGGPGTITVNVTNASGAAVFLSAWVDFNRNGVLTDAGEQVATNTSIANGTSGVNQTINFTTPVGAAVGTAGIRVRLSSVSGALPTGASGNGEVEDYTTSIIAPTTDLGDFNGFADASSTVVGTIKIGATTDVEYAATTNAIATGDDTTGSDDEDGVTLPTMIAGQTVTVPVVVTNTSGTVVYLNAWIDFNNNGVVTDSGEQVATNVNIANGTNGATQNISVMVPTSAVTTSAVGVRVRLTSTITPGSTGVSGNGEIEDYAVAIQSPITDFGDFGGFADAFNNATSSLRMGALVDSEYASTVNVAATGDNITGTNDEDGVTIPAMTAGAPATITVVVTNSTGAGAFLNAWIDYNNNGSLADAGEQIATNVNIANGASGTTQNINITVPATVTTGTNLGVRVRITAVTTPGPTGGASVAGEVEDYIVNIAAPTTDFGDFSTFASASSTVNSNLKIGALTDTEYVQTANTSAAGDDTTGVDDEDGVTLPALTAGAPATIPMIVTNNTGAVAYLNAWIDYNNNGVVTDSGEQIATNVNIANGTTGATQNLNITVPATATTSVNLGVRVRLTSVNTATSTGLSGNGEVEDYIVNIAAPTTDFGDFTGFADASNGITPNIRIGATTDAEFASTKDATATGDDLTGSDDEDGVTIPAMTAGAPATIPVVVTNTNGAAAFLNVWIDYNNNGSLADSGEQVATNVSIANGTNGATQNVNITVPATATTGTSLGVRVRLTSITAPGATGAGGGSGEVEDYVVTIAAPTTDFGDFSTLASASSTVVGTLKIGALTDAEYVQTANTAATGDDITGSDDEDGVTMPSVIAGAPATIPVVVTNNTGAVAYLNAWIDFNNNGVVTDSGEQIATNVNIANGTTGATQNLNITVPATAVTGLNVGVRFRLTSVNTTTSTGLSGNGEVEDYVVNIAAPTTDFGDFGSFADASNGVSPNLLIGATTDAEYSSTKDATATGDDLTGSDDEDGVTVPSMIAGQGVTMPVVVTNANGSAAFLNAWIDYNNNGSLADAGEQVATNVSIANGTAGGTQNLNFTVPATATTGANLGIRVRLTSTSAPGPAGTLGGSGEVEDYIVNIAVPTTDFGDFNGVASASSTVSSGLKIGALTDVEYAQTANPAATGDDITGSDDEDGVTVPAMVAGAPATMPVVVTNNSGAPAYLNAWIDFNRNGSFADSGEQVAADVLIVSGTTGATQNLSYTAAASAVTGINLGVRVRLTSVLGAASVGLAGTGEVEDYVTSITAPPTDFGDFSSFADAASAADTNLRIGATVDTEFVSTRNGTATGDDNTGSDDEDGVTLPSMTAGAPATIPVVVTNNTGAVGYLNAWIDYNNNGSLADAGDQIATNLVIATGTTNATQNINITVPASAVTGATLGIRFRLTSTISPGATGSSGGSGEVEDYVTSIATPTTDFGDWNGAADAWSTATSNLRIGSLADTEYVSTLNAAATGDDTTGSDDEDGVTVPATLTLGAPGSITVNVTNTTGVVSYLNAWIDFNRNGSFADAGERIATNTSIANNTNGVNQVINFTTPVGASTGITGIRVRLTDVNTTTSTGASSNGEVEDYVSTIIIPTTDFGDFATFADASSTQVATIKIGATTDTEYVSTKNAAATGDDITGADDEDGVTMPASINTSASVTIPVTVTNTSGAAAYLNGWIDFDNNGTLIAGEQIVTDVVIANGTSGATQSVTFTVPSGASVGAARGVRFRLTSTITPGPTGASGNGEVEDYSVAINQGLTIGNIVWYDVNNNGTKDVGETGLDAVAVQLYTPGVDGNVNTGDDVLVTSTTTSGGGMYSFIGLSPADYFIKVTPPAGYPLTSGTPSTTDNNVDNNNDGAQPSGLNTALFSPKINLAVGAESITDGDANANTNMTVDFGLFSGIAVGNLVWNDSNNNGLYDSGTESGISGLTVELLNGGTNAVITSTTTNGAGVYGFTVYSAGSYKVRVTPNGSFPLATTAVNLDNGVDNDSNGVQTTQGTAATTAAFTLTFGGEPGTGGTGNAENTIDFGFRTCPTITVNPASLTDGFVNTPYSQTVSSTNGIGASTFAVSVGALPAWASLDANTGMISGTPSATGTTNFTIRATDSVGCQGTRALSITVRGLKVGNLVWSDTNNNGAKDVGEPGLGGITVELWSSGANTNEENGGGDDVKIATDVVTNGSGIYSFINVPAGVNYYVRIPTLPFTNYRTGGTPFTLDNGVDNDNNGQQTAMGAPVRSPRFTLAGGTEPAVGIDGDDTDGELTIDVGLTPTLGLGNLVFKDLNNNGFYDAANDTVVDGVTLQLFTSGADPLVATPVATTTTAGGGLYIFYALPGSYFVYVPASQFLTGGALENTRPSLEPVGVPVVDDNGDQNALATAKPAVTGVSTGVFTLTVGAAPNTASGETGFNSASDNAYDTNADLTIDLGFYPTGTPGFPLAGHVSRTLTPVAAPAASDVPLSGVTVSLYADANADGTLQTDEMSAVAAADTTEDGTFEFTAVQPGDYLVVQSVLPGAVAAYDTDGGNKECTALTVTNEHIDGIDFLQCIAPETFFGWQAQNALGGANAAGDNPDGDLASNLLEYALGTSAADGKAKRRFWIEGNAASGIDALLIRASAGHRDVSYAVEGSTDLVTWTTLSITPSVTQNNDSTETVRFVNVGVPFVRLKVALDADQDGTAEATALSQVQGWNRAEFDVGQQTFSMPLLRDEIFAGTVSSVADKVLSGIAPTLVAGTSYFAEVISGSLEGQRFEVDVASSGAPGLALTAAPPAGIAGSRVVVRPHWTVAGLFQGTTFHATTSSKTADRVMFFDAAKQSYRVFWLYAAQSGPRWVRDADASLADAGATVVGPADAVIVQSRTEAVSVLQIGQVRSWKFAVSLIKGSQFIGAGYPIAQSPADRAMTHGFTADTEAASADRVQLWKGDAVQGATGYDSYHAQPSGQGSFWMSDGLNDVTNVKLFGAFKGAFVISVDGGAGWVQPVPGNP